jgi:hypothetical protein
MFFFWAGGIWELFSHGFYVLDYSVIPLEIYGIDIWLHHVVLFAHIWATLNLKDGY